MTRFVAMRILANHTGTENRQLALVGRFIREHTVQTFGKAGFSSGQFNQAIDIMGYRPIVLPSITFTNILDIGFRIIVRDKVSFRITRLHERSLRIEHVSVVL